MATSAEPTEDDRSVRAKTELYFGLSIPNGGAISSIEWNNFLENEIIPLFPGLTCFEADGVWYGKQGQVVHEKSRVVILIHPDTPDCESLIEGIRNKYKKLFWQESVLKVSTIVSASF